MKAKTLPSAIEYWETLYKVDINMDVPSDIYNDFIIFLREKLKLWMFIPCDKDGKPLEKPDDYNEYIQYQIDEKITTTRHDILEYQQACDRVLFKGFEYNQILQELKCYEPYFRIDISSLRHKTISDLANKVEVTDRISKQFKLK